MTKLTYRAETQAGTTENSNSDEIFKYIRRNQRKKWGKKENLKINFILRE